MWGKGQRLGPAADGLNGQRPGPEGGALVRNWQGRKHTGRGLLLPPTPASDLPLVPPVGGA